MIQRPAAIFCALFAALVLGGCATGDKIELGEGKAEFEQYSQGGNYRFQYVAEGSDGYRAVLWRQGDSLSDDRKDEKLVAGVVRAVFLDKFCKELKQPVSIADGSPAPVGAEGKWTAALRCAAPPPPPPKPAPEKKKVKVKPRSESVAASKSEAAPAPESTSSSASKSKSAPAPKSAGDGPVECVSNGAGGFDCKPKK